MRSKGTVMTNTTLRSACSAIALCALVLASAPAWALNEVYESTCGPTYPCVKPPSENLCLKQIGDLDANGAMVTATGALAKGKKKTMLKIDTTFEWFSLGNTFRSFNLKVNGKFAVNFTVLNHLDSCASGACVRHMTWYYDMDDQEAVYPGQFYGQPLVITFDSSRAVDANSYYNLTLCAQVLKKK